MLTKSVIDSSAMYSTEAVAVFIGDKTKVSTELSAFFGPHNIYIALSPPAVLNDKTSSREVISVHLNEGHKNLKLDIVGYCTNRRPGAAPGEI